MRKHGKMAIRMTYEVVMPYHLHMPSYFLGTFTEYPYVYMNAVIGTSATRTTFIFQTVTIIAYQIYLWTISNFSTSLSVYWTAEYLYVILLGVLSIINLKCKNY